MSFTFPKTIEEEIKDFARARNISPNEAAIKLVSAALAATKEAPLLTRERNPDLYDKVQEAIRDIDSGQTTPLD